MKIDLMATFFVLVVAITSTTEAFAVTKVPASVNQSLSAMVHLAPSCCCRT
jgi:hypothetical protein